MLAILQSPLFDRNSSVWRIYERENCSTHSSESPTASNVTNFVINIAYSVTNNSYKQTQLKLDIRTLDPANALTSREVLQERK